MFHPVKAEEMAFAMTLFLNAATGQISADQKPLSITSREEGVRLFLQLLPADEGLKAQQGGNARVLNTELFPAFIIVWEHYRDDAVQASLAARLLGFYQLMVQSKGQALAPWTQESGTTDEMVELHPAIINTLASTRLSKDGRLDETRFLGEVRAAVKAFGPRPERSPGAIGWPVHDGEMADRVREFAWETTPLGGIDHWPQSLKTAVDLALACRFAMVVLWGPELLQIYNDSYCDLMGRKHPGGLGEPTRACWPEVWDINEPIYAHVWNGEALTFEDRLYSIRRHGYLEDAYFTLCYSPLRDHLGTVAGILVTVLETTERVQAELNRGGAAMAPPVLP